MFSQLQWPSSPSRVARCGMIYRYVLRLAQLMGLGLTSNTRAVCLCSCSDHSHRFDWGEFPLLACEQLSNFTHGTLTCSAGKLRVIGSLQGRHGGHWFQHRHGNRAVRMHYGHVSRGRLRRRLPVPERRRQDALVFRQCSRRFDLLPRRICHHGRYDLGAYDLGAYDSSAHTGSYSEAHHADPQRRTDPGAEHGRTNPSAEHCRTNSGANHGDPEAHHRRADSGAFNGHTKAYHCCADAAAHNRHAQAHYGSPRGDRNVGACSN